MIFPRFPAILQAMPEEKRSFYRREHKPCGPVFLEAREWSAGRMWLPRLLLLFYMTWVFFQSLRDPLYQSIFKALNLGIHELGHLVTTPLGQFISIASGSLFQCLAPVVGFFMFLRQRDWFALGVAVWWLGTNLHDVAAYAGDARSLSLTLVTPFGGGEVIHDWHYLFSRTGLLEHDQAIAALLRLGGFLAMLAGIAWGAVTVFWMIRTRKEAAKPGVNQ
ncbi:MAG: hypothetical protein RB296_03450 [Acidobacteriota bacterium]|nr:hypothetical protein [Acidobacteriota bacterium]